MKHALLISAALVLAAIEPAQAQSVRELINQAVAAQGGADALRALKALAIKADAMYWEPGQSKAAGGEPRFLGNTTLAITWDLAKGMARTEWDRDMKYPSIEKIKYTDVITPSLGYVTDEKAARLHRASASPPRCASSTAPRRPCSSSCWTPKAACGRWRTRSSATGICSPSVSLTAARISPSCSIL
jgi:hypothetical protein